MKLFMPERVFFEPQSLGYPLGREMYELFRNQNIEITVASPGNIAKHMPQGDEKHRFAWSKNTLAVAVKKGRKLDVCRPSADFEFSLASNCPGSCEYCYLQTNPGCRPYIKVFANLEDIFNNILRHIAENGNRVTTFEAASLGDPLALEHLAGSVAKTIEFFGALENGRLRIVTKYSFVDSLLELEHHGHTRFRFSVNSRFVIDNFEHNTSRFEERIEAASKISGAGYPIGFVVAPIMVYEGWKEQYSELFEKLSRKINTACSREPVSFELIQHRFTGTAKKHILQRFPNTRLDMDESKRRLKWGRFGRYKYVYPKEQAAEIGQTISTLINERFPGAIIEYFT